MALQKEEAFLKTVELSSLTLAAQALGRTQSAISHSIRALEEELGVTLLTRSKGGVRLTREGRELLPTVQALHGARETLLRQAAALSGRPDGRVRIGTFTSVAVHWLPGMIKSFRQRYPQVPLEMFSGDYSDVENWLREGQVDLAFTTLPAPEGCEAQPLTDDELMAILPPEHPLAARERIPAELLALEPFITLLRASDQDIRRALGGLQPEVRFTTKDDYAIIAMVEQGLGVSVMPKLLMEGRQDRVAVRPLDPPARRTIALARRPGETGAAARLFSQCVLDWIREAKA